MIFCKGLNSRARGVGIPHGCRHLDVLVAVSRFGNEVHFRLIDAPDVDFKSAAQQFEIDHIFQRVPNIHRLVAEHRSAKPKVNQIVFLQTGQLSLTVNVEASRFIEYKAVHQRIEVLVDGFDVALSTLCIQVVRNSFGCNKAPNILKEKATNAQKERRVRELQPQRQILEQDCAEDSLIISAHRLGIGKRERIREGADFQISAIAFTERTIGVSAFNKLAEGHREHLDFDIPPAQQCGEV